MSANPAQPPSSPASPSNGGSMPRPKKSTPRGPNPKKLIMVRPRMRPRSTRAELDVRVGGRFAIVFHTEDGEEHHVSGVYREVVPNEKLVFTWAWRTTPERESLVTVLIKPDGAGSLLTLIHEQFFDEPARDRHAMAGPAPRQARTLYLCVTGGTP